MKIEDIKVGDKLFIAEDNSTFKFDSFRVIEATVTYIMRGLGGKPIQYIYVSQKDNNGPDVGVLDTSYVSEFAFKKRTDAQAKINQMKKDAESARKGETEKKPAGDKESAPQQETKSTEGGK